MPNLRFLYRFGERYACFIYIYSDLDGNAEAKAKSSSQINAKKQFISLENQNFISISRTNRDKITATREQGGFGWQILQKWYPHIRGR